MSSDVPHLQRARRLQHDLGKYVCLQVRWLGDDPEPASLREALVADLLTTRRGPEGATDAGALWAELRQDWPEVASVPELAEIEERMAWLAPVIAAARQDALDDATVAQGVRWAREVSELAKRLVSRLAAEGASRG